MERLIGVYEGNGRGGAVLFVTAGIHGNEASGVTALKKIFSELGDHKPEISGTVIGIRGNTEGLKAGKRYLDEDLNRVWTRENILSGKADTSEKKEMFDIIRSIDLFSSGKYREYYFLDCHTTSSATRPFISVQDRGGNVGWAYRFPLPVVCGFSDIVNGCIDQYLSSSGMTGFVFEGGRHTAPSVVKHQECMIWLAIEKACGLHPGQIPGLPGLLRDFGNNDMEQSVFRIIYRHILQEGDRFVMQPGFANFQKIGKGELLAIHNGREVVSRWDSYIFMPLYQSQGKDGFFIIERDEIHPA
ncbi:M14 family metallopeptidase [Sinomicrobium soli]|uniref:succinylglutamate desuccinylase/aspartoacylase domain-containing protein n=1 Tax=Sinomicrobium sp. N-1-3-6 TaxID=2219864 RepID=UPI000DCB270D|nr:succinylglutamate desuccinylase/aspartoacylase family protein [Sinomicrobium sp. N-1-3-6]RAV28647.1 succinylglutamate desuccinylase [Sinomicrobium sp. N-1-3-6]